MGTAFGMGHINLIKKYKVNKIIMLLDQDKAGKQSTIKIADMLTSNNINDIKVVKFRQYKDIDELVSSGGDPKSLIKNAYDYFEFKIEYYQSEMTLDSISDKLKFAELFTSDVKNAMPNLKVLLVNKISTALNMSVDEINSIYNVSDNTKKVDQRIEDFNQAPIDNYDNMPPETFSANQYDDSYYNNNAPNDYNQTPSTNYNSNSISKQQHFNPKSHAIALLGDEDACIAFGLKSREFFNKVVISQERGNISFKKHRELYDCLYKYYLENTQFELIDFIDFSRNPKFFDICQNLMDNENIDLEKVPIILETPHKKLPPGRDLIRRKRR